MQSYESILSKEANKNSYLNAILLMQLAIHKLAYAEQKSLLMEALSNEKIKDNIIFWGK